MEHNNNFEGGRKNTLVSHFWNIFLGIADPLNLRDLFFSLSQQGQQERLKEMAHFARENNLTKSDILQYTVEKDKETLHLAKELGILEQIFSRGTGLAMYGYLLYTLLGNSQLIEKPIPTYGKQDKQTIETVGLPKMTQENKRIFNIMKTFLEFHKNTLSQDKKEILEGILSGLKNRGDESYIGYKYAELIKNDFPELYNKIIKTSKTVTRNAAKDLSFTL